MAVERQARSRRALLAGGMSSLAALALAAIGRSAPVDAANGQTVKVGQSHAGSSLTAIESSSNGFKGKASGAGGSGIIGESTSSTGFGVNGFNNTSGTGVRGGAGAGGTGVRGSAGTGGTGVYGNSARGVMGETRAPNGFGVVAKQSATTGDGNGLRALALSPSAHAIYAENSSTGTSGTAIEARSSTETTVRVMNLLGTTFGKGVVASASGVGVDAEGRFGVFGTASHPVSEFAAGVRGAANDTNHFAGSFENLNTNGFALQVRGGLRLNGAAGIANISSGSSSVTVTPTLPFRSGSLVIATLQSPAGAGVTVSRAVVGVSSFQIFLTGDAGQDCKVGWIMVN